MAIITRALAFASGIDAGNRSMRAAGRSAWNQDDADSATATTNRLLLYVPFSEHGLGGLNLSPAMRAELLIGDADWARSQDASGAVADNLPCVQRARRGTPRPTSPLAA